MANTIIIVSICVSSYVWHISGESEMECWFLRQKFSGASCKRGGCDGLCAREGARIKWDQGWQTGFSSLDTSNSAGWMWLLIRDGRGEYIRAHKYTTRSMRRIRAEWGRGTYHGDTKTWGYEDIGTMELYGRINTQLGVCDRYVRSEAGARIKTAGIASIINSLRIYNTVNP